MVLLEVNGGSRPTQNLGKIVEAHAIVDKLSAGSLARAFTSVPMPVLQCGLCLCKAFALVSQCLARVPGILRTYTGRD